MTGITTGEYHIRLAASPSPLVGANSPVQPGVRVVTDGSDSVFFVEAQPHGFVLYLDGYPVQAVGGNVVIGQGPPTFWTIDGPDGGPYTIHLPPYRGSPDLVWTVPVNQGPDVPNDSPVVLRPFISQPEVPENQKWYFLHVPPPGQ